MGTHTESNARLRTRWAAIGAAVAVTLGAGGIGLAQASVDSGAKPVTISVDPGRALDTRFNIGLNGAFSSATPRDLQVTGEIDVATPDNQVTKRTVVPAGASAALVNVTVVEPTDLGFLSLRAGGAAGAPSTSTVNFQALSTEPNAATVPLSADGKLQVYVFMPTAGATANVLIDIVGYTIDHDHDDRYYTEAEVDAALGGKADAADVYTKSEVDAAVAAIPDTRDQTFSRTFFNIPAGTFGTRQATCPADMMAVSGGFGMFSPPASGTITMQQSSPDALVNGLPTAWFVDVHNSGGVDIEGFIDLICVSID